MNVDTTISVVIPAYNLAGFIEKALESVCSQTSLPDEILVVDDGSADATPTIVERFAGSRPPGFIRLLRQERKGPGAARNHGIQEAKGNWVSFLDGDDVWLADKISKVREAIAVQPDAVIVAHDEYEVGLDGHEILKPLHAYYHSELKLFPQLFRRCFFSTSCITANRSALLAVGGFDTSLPSAQDFELWLKLAHYEKLVFVPLPLAKYVLRPNSISANIDNRLICLLRIFRRHLPRLKTDVGTFGAYGLCLTVALICHYSAMASFASQGRFGKAMQVFLSAPGSLAALLFVRGE